MTVYRSTYIRDSSAKCPRASEANEELGRCCNGEAVVNSGDGGLLRTLRSVGVSWQRSLQEKTSAFGFAGIPKVTLENGRQ